VSPLSRDAYLLVLATATSIFRGMTAPSSLLPPETEVIQMTVQSLGRSVVDDADTADTPASSSRSTADRGVS
jgi:hypothetical protein